MTAFLIGAAELDALAAGQPSVVAAPGMPGLNSLRLAVLQPSRGVLRRVGAPDGTAVLLPPGLRLLAILAPSTEAGASFVAGLPEGTPLLVSTEPLKALLVHLAAEALAAAEIAANSSTLHCPPSLLSPTTSVPVAASSPNLIPSL